MRATEEIRREGNALFQALRAQIRAGDKEAVEALRDLALNATDILESFTRAADLLHDAPEALHEGARAVQGVAKGSTRWPVSLHAVKEIRDAELADWGCLDVGAEIGIRLGGKRRGLSYDEQVGFALDVWQEIEAIRGRREHMHLADIHPELAAPGVLTEGQARRTWRNLAAILPPLDRSALSEWADVGREVCREWCQGDWSRFPWPECVASKAGGVTDENGHERTTESAVRTKIFDGLAKLIP